MFLCSDAGLALDHTISATNVKETTALHAVIFINGAMVRQAVTETGPISIPKDQRHIALQYVTIVNGIVDRVFLELIRSAK